MDNEIDEIAWPEETNNASENQLSGYNESDTDVVKSRKDVDPIDKSIIRRREYICWKSGTHQSKKVEDISLHQDCSSYKTNCLWQASFYLGKKSNLIRLTKFVQEHNHQCDPETIELAPKNLRLPQQIINKIEHYTTNGNLGAEQQYKLLVQEFPQYNIAKKNLYNAIQKFRGVRIHDKTDAATMLLSLLKQREDDPDYVVIPRLEGPANELTGLFWMTSYQSKSKLRGDMASSFVEDFYTMRNSYSEEQFNTKYQEMLDKYEPCHPYLEKRIYPSRESWARYCISKIFTAGIESIQRVESINGVIKKLVDRGTLLKELVMAIERELDKESHYTRINDFYGSNPSVGLPSTYNTIFKELDSVLKANLLAIPLSIHRAQMNQSLLYQANLVSINQVEDEETNFNNSVLGILGHSHDIPQIRLRELLNGISYNDITEIWEVSYIASKTSKSHYVVILKDATLLCTCMFIVNQGMICRHQFRVLIQSDNVIFHISHIHTRWFNLSSDPPTNSTGFITIVNGEKNHTTIPLSYMNQLRTDNVYTPTIREKVNKKIQYGAAMSIAKTSIQIAVTEDVTAELIGILTQFIMKYRRSTGLSIEKSTESLQDSQGSSIQDNLQPLSVLPDISNPEYHKSKGRPPKRYKSTVENNRITSGKPDDVTVQKTCSYCSGKGHNICGCPKYKAESSANKENEYLV
ncbi:unnamed protein product [Rhizophagus irregularis]|uniref:SWIM-type domain-containing protein n=1 Tax=Rhizophagus irregularis TaxID=588596 RepID=A0A916EAQ2_9GLOM|nr:unnamed protein product [Rhizophagus irregularis]